MFDPEKIKAADGKAIKVGSVLKKIGKDTTGVVTSIIKPGDYAGMMSQVGDIQISESGGISTVSNKYSTWEHVPKAEQSFRHRYISWLHTPFTAATENKDEFYIEALMDLVDDEIIGEDWPFEFSYAVELIARQLAKESGQKF